MGSFVNLEGRVFGRWTVVGRSSVSCAGKVTWDCVCVCGNTKPVTSNGLMTGDSKSCGCLHREMSSVSATKHGLIGVPEYKVYQDMKRRCYDSTRNDYVRYGGRGIFVCDRWLESFAHFYADMGPRGKGLTLERIDNECPYSPENCKWATIKEQNNNSRKNRPITHNGVTHNLSTWAEIAGIPVVTLFNRLKKHPLGTALTGGDMRRFNGVGGLIRSSSHGGATP